MAVATVQTRAVSTLRLHIFSGSVGQCNFPDSSIEETRPMSATSLPVLKAKSLVEQATLPWPSKRSCTTRTFHFCMRFGVAVWPDPFESLSATVQPDRKRLNKQLSFSNYELVVDVSRPF